MKKAVIWVAVVIVVILVAVSVSGQNSTGGTINIGFMGPLSGDNSALGVSSRIATEMAVEEVNNAGGVGGKKINLIAEDDKCNAEAANSAANKLINIDHVSAIIGGLCSTETSAFAPMAMQKKVPVISYCSSAPSLSNTGQYFFRTYPSDSFQGKFAAEYLYSKGSRKVAVIYHISDWGTGLKDVFSKRFTELGGTIVATEGTSQESRDYRTQLTKANSSGADYIYSPMYAQGGTAFIAQWHDMGIKIKVMGGDAWDDSKFQKDIVGKGDIIYSGQRPTIDDAFSQKLLAKTGEAKVSICAPQAYDAVNVLVQAMQRVGTDPDKLQAAIRATNIDGVSGHVSFDGNGDVQATNYLVKKISNGTTTEIN